MSGRAGLGLVLAGMLGCAAVGSGQSGQPGQPGPRRAQEDPNRIVLDVVVTPKNGGPVSGLQKDDFTILDNKVARPITSFKAMGGKDEPIEVVMVVDAVNETFQNIAYERQFLNRFLQANGGHLAYPTTIAIFTDTGTQIQEGYSTDGNAMKASLDQQGIGLREIRRSSGFYGASERLNLSLTALQMLASKEAARPGRKIILWVSPGWPLLSGPAVQLDAKQTEGLFSQIVSLSTFMRQGGITMYSVDPLGASEGVGRTFYYEDFLKGVSKSSQVQLGDLGLQVLAVQSGGLALSGNNDIASLLERCMADTQAYYELSFEAPPGDKRDEYHSLEVKVGKPGLVARTRTGYYAQP